MLKLVVMAALIAAAAHAQDTLESRAQKYLIDLIKLDATNPPGNETPVARYLKRVCDAEGIPSEILGGDPKRMNFIARLDGPAGVKPLLIMAHSDVVPADPKQWTADPYGAEIRAGYIYGRGTQDTLSLVAAELSVMVELKRSGRALRRGIVFLSEADEEAGSTGIRWLIDNAWPKIDAEFAINEGGWAMPTSSGGLFYQIQTSEKIPTRVVLTGRGVAGHGSLPRDDNPVVHLARAITRLAEAEQPAKLNATTRRYFAELATDAQYAWLKAYDGKLEESAAAIRKKSPELGSQLATSVSPTMLDAGQKINVIPNAAEAQVDVRRLPNETREEVMERFRRIINDPAVEVKPAEGQTMPPTEPSSQTTELYLAMERVFKAESPKARVVPFMVRGATDGAYLRAKGMAVYGAPVFQYPEDELRFHGNDERIAVENLARGTRLLLKIVDAVAGR